MDALLGIIIPRKRRVAPTAAVTTFNPLDKNANAFLSNGDRTLTGRQGENVHQPARGTVARLDGRRYLEYRIDAGSAGWCVGLANAAASLASNTTFGNGNANGFGILHNLRDIYNNVQLDGNSLSGSYAPVQAPVTGDVINFAVDMDTRRLYIGRNGAYFGGMNPGARTGGILLAATGALFPAAACRQGPTRSQITLNCGQTPFASAPPSGFSAWG